MSSIIGVAMLQWNHNLIAYFRNKKATSSNSAISIKWEEFKKTYTFWLPPSTNILKQPYIKTNDKGNYYLDEEILKIYSAKAIRNGLIILILSILLLAFFLIIKFSY